MFLPILRFRKTAFAILFAALLLCGMFAAFPISAQGIWRGSIIPQDYANSKGLHRQWIAHAEFNPYSSIAEKVCRLTFDRDSVFIITDQGTIQAFEAETGKTKWVTYTKTKGKVIQGLAASKYYVAFTAGSTLFVLNRKNGKILLDDDIPAIPTNELTLGENCAYVPAINGLIYIFNLQPMEDPMAELGISTSMLSEKERKARKEEFIDSLRLVKSESEPMSIRSIGDLKVTPTVLRCNDEVELVAWPTGSKLVTVCDVVVNERMADERYNIPVIGEAVSALSYRPYDPEKPNSTGIVFAGTTDGFVYAVDETSGNVKWRFPAGEYIKETPYYVDGEVFIATAISGMYCIDALTGGSEGSSEAKWWAPNIRHFVSCSPHRIYALDNVRNLVILDRASGQKISTFPVSDFKFVSTNVQNDRIYVATESGTIQCIREIALETPVDFSTAWIESREHTMEQERRAARQEARAKANEKKKKKNKDRMGDDEDGGWGEDSDDSEDGDFGFGDDEESEDEDSSDDEESEDEDFGDDEESEDEDFEDDEESEDEDFGDDEESEDEDFGDDEESEDEDFGDDEESEDEDFGDDEEDF